jgi:hypothetical protein
MKKFNNWREVVENANKIVSGDNFITAFVDGVGIGIVSNNSDYWAFIPIGGYTYMGVELSQEYYAELKGDTI